MELKVIKFTQNNLELEVTISPLEETVWLSLDDMAVLFNRDRSVIGKHVRNALKEECDKNSVWAKFARTGSDGKQYYVDYYNLDIVISVGYRVKSPNGVVFRKWANGVLKEYLLRGYTIDGQRTLVSDENYIALINKVESLDGRISKIERDQNYFFKDRIIFAGHIFDALSLINDIIEKAVVSIVLIDPYCDIKTLNALKGKPNNVTMKIITSSKSRLSQTDIEAFGDDYGNLTVVYSEDYHDRYLVVDSIYYYHLGASINYLGRRLSQITLIEDEDVKKVLASRF